MRAGVLTPASASHLLRPLSTLVTMSFEIGTRIQKDFGGKQMQQSRCFCRPCCNYPPPRNIGTLFGGTVTSKDTEQTGGKVSKLFMHPCMIPCCIPPAPLGPSTRFPTVLQTLYHVKYDDGDEEDLYIEELSDLVVKVC